MSGLELSVFGMIRVDSPELYPATLFIRVYFIPCIVAFYAMTDFPSFRLLLGLYRSWFVLRWGLTSLTGERVTRCEDRYEHRKGANYEL